MFGYLRLSIQFHSHSPCLFVCSEFSHETCCDFPSQTVGWLVVSTPPNNMSLSIGMMKLPIYNKWENIKVMFQSPPTSPTSELTRGYSTKNVRKRPVIHADFRAGSLGDWLSCSTVRHQRPRSRRLVPNFLDLQKFRLTIAGITYVHI